jgi:lipocalin-like protein
LSDEARRPLDALSPPHSFDSARFVGRCRRPRTSSRFFALLWQASRSIRRFGARGWIVSIVNSVPLSKALVGTWDLLSREDVSSAGQRHTEASLGSDPFGLLFYDAKGNFAAQFMKRARDDSAPQFVAQAAVNNSRAQGGYDAYFGTYTVDDAEGTVTQRLIGALSRENVGQVLTRAMSVAGDELVIRVHTATSSGSAIIRTLLWRRIG